MAQYDLIQICRPRLPFSIFSILLGSLNQRDERGTVRVGRVSAKPVWAMRREMLSQRDTTRWEEVIGVHG